MKKIPNVWPYINPDASYPIGEAAELVQISRSTLRRDINNGAIRAYKSTKSGRLRLLGADLLDYREHTR